MGHIAWQLTKRAYEYMRKNGMAKKYLDIISNEEIEKEKQKQKDFENNL